MKKRKILCGILAALVIICSLTLFASAADTASATLNGNAVSAWSGQINNARQIELTKAVNEARSKHRAYFDFKYYNGSSWKKDKNAADLAINTSIGNTHVKSNLKGAGMSWILQINTWCCWYRDCFASGTIEKVS